MVSMARAGLAFFGLEYKSETTPHPIDTIQPTHRPNRERGPDWLSSDWNTNPRPHYVRIYTYVYVRRGRGGPTRRFLPVHDFPLQKNVDRGCVSANASTCMHNTQTNTQPHHPADPPTK